MDAAQVGTCTGRRCVRMSERGQVRRFATTTVGLFELAGWPRQAGCTHVAMEATGVYWKPVWHMGGWPFNV